MDLQRGLALLLQQYKALLMKNFRLSCRNKRSVLLQIFPCFFFILLMFSIDKGLNYGANADSARTVDKVTDPKPLLSPPIPPCEDKVFAKKPCYDFLWTGVGNLKIQNIVDGIMQNNPGRKIPPHKVKSFKTKGEVDNWFLKNPLSCPGALHFEERNASVISYGIQTSTTQTQLGTKRDLGEDPTFDFQIPLQIAAEREIARSLIGDPNFSWDVGLKEFAHPAWEIKQTGEVLKISAANMGMEPIFFLAMVMFGFVFQISSLVTEKELKLRQAMTMMGLYDTAYWLSWLTWEGIMTLLSSLSIVIFGMIFRYNFFLKNSIVIVFLVFFLFQLNMTGYAFMLSTFFSKSSSSSRVAFSIFIIGFLTQVVTQIGFPYNPKSFKKYGIIWSLFPPNLLAQALRLLHTEAGVAWSGRTKCPPENAACVLTINDVYYWLMATFVLWFMLASYFDNIFPNALGVRKPIFYFLMPGYWTGKGGNKMEEGSCCCTDSVPVFEHVTPDDEDVLEEESNVKEQTRKGMVESNVAVQIRGLLKTYPGKMKMGCCCKCEKTSPFHAVKGLWMNVDKDQLFCLLGPNGAGKTTVISCLTGIAPVTAGDAFIYGNSIRSSTGLSNIRRIVGVCPQFDILWDELTAQEHLHLFASIKGLPPASIKSVAENSLAEVRLTGSAKVRAGSYSGGMKRRLSVAIALIGDPKLIILDEPTTGMDPISRRHVWDIIENAKRGRAIILTTHSMEEADILGDRIGIMAKGRLCCIGSSIRLKSRFGTGFVANIRFTGSNNGENLFDEDAIGAVNHEVVKQFFKYHLNIFPKEESKDYLSFIIPRNREPLLTEFFAQLQYREREFGIADIQLGLTTLEEVFLNIARQAELENSQAEGKLVTLILTSGVSVEIPFGARFVGIPGTETAENPRGFMVEVYWETDDSGSLQIAGHSLETPVPPGVGMSSHSVSTSLGRNKKVRGVVIELSQLGTSNV